MSELLTKLSPDGVNVNSESFQPTARYYRAMDFLLYLTEDCSYRADRIDAFLTLLWHPQQERAIGIKLKGFRFIFERIKGVLDGQNIPLDDKHFLSLISALEIAMASGMGDAIIADAERERRQRGYETAKEVIGNTMIPQSELQRLMSEHRVVA